MARTTPSDAEMYQPLSLHYDDLIGRSEKFGFLYISQTSACLSRNQNLSSSTKAARIRGNLYDLIALGDEMQRGTLAIA